MTLHHCRHIKNDKPMADIHFAKQVTQVDTFIALNSPDSPQQALCR
jgi:hypothetical protein